MIFKTYQSFYAEVCHHLLHYLLTFELVVYPCAHFCWLLLVDILLWEFYDMWAEPFLLFNFLKIYLLEKGEEE